MLFVLTLVAFAVSLLTLFSGFGLGTLLMPAFALFFPVSVAVAATAIVHLANGLFKAALLFSYADRRVILRFGLPAIAAAFLGALALSRLAHSGPLARPLFSWQPSFRQTPAEATTIELVMGALILLFALIELAPNASRLRFSPRWLPLGGAISGFFGGLSGHQGAMRAAFLLPLGLGPKAFAGTQAVIACLVDITRLIVYGSAWRGWALGASSDAVLWRAVALAILGAIVGSLLGRTFLEKVTMKGLRWITGCLLLVVGTALGTGLF